MRLPIAGQVYTRENEQQARGLVEQNSSRVLARLIQIEANIQTLLEELTYAAYGGVRLTTETPGADITAAWQDIDLFDAVGVAPKGIAFNGGQFAFEVPGVYQVTLGTGLEHNSANDGRATFLRLFDVTEGTGYGSLPVGIGRNVEFSSPGATFIVEVDEAHVGDTYVMQIGGGDTLSAVVWISQSLSISSVGEYRGAL